MSLCTVQMDAADMLSRYGLGVCLAAMGDYEGALQCLGSALDLAPKDPLVLASVGAVMHRQGNLAGAVAKFRAALHEDSDLAEAHANMALCLKQQVCAVADERVHDTRHNARPHAQQGNHFDSIDSWKTALHLNDDLPGAK